MALDLDAIKARAEAATKGPWKFTPKILGIKNTTVMAGGEQVGYFSVGQAQPHDAEFISHARQDIPALLAEVERLQAIVERVRKLHAPEVRTVSVPVFDEFDSPSQTDTYCVGCGGWGSSQKLHRLCPTIRALEDL